jgi:F-type H+-transporting ATPase subunit alpha
MPEDILSISKEVGYVVSAQDYLLNIEGLPSASVNDIVVSENGARALVNIIERDRVEALMLDPDRPRPGESFTLTGSKLTIPLHVNLLSRAINPLGTPIDKKGKFPPGGVEVDLDVVAPGIADRAIVSEQLFTGITVIDTLLPIGKGQRELMFGEPRSGKSSFMLDIIHNQKGENKICIYAAIGRADIDVQRFIEQLEKTEASKYTIVLAATSSDSAPLISVAPSIACSLAEHYRNQGQNVLLILDDLGTHSKYLREIGLLSGRTPGRESYPPDIFYQHSRLVERAGNFNEHFGSGSITLLPVIETDLENFTGLIPTNVMSMTDGHLLFSAALRAGGQYPAIEVDRSVTRVGRQTQSLIHKILSDKVRSLIADFHELERYGRFGAELTSETQTTIKRGSVITELLRQEPLEKIEPKVQILLLSLVFTGFFDTKDIEFVRCNKSNIIRALGEKKELETLKKQIDTVKLDELIENLKQYKNVVEASCQA